MLKRVNALSLLAAIACAMMTANISVAVQKAQPSKDKTAQLRQRLQEKLNELHAAGKFPGATAGFALADGTIFGLATGMSNVETQTRMTPNDLLFQGSVGKTYCAAVMMQLVAEKRVNLDDKIEKYFGKEPWFTRLPNARDITIRMLMNHTSGLVRYELNPKFTADLTRSPDKVWSGEDRLAYLFDTKAAFEAGKGWDYSDTNYIVVGMIIERVTKNTFYNEARKRVLKPMGLKRTVPTDSRTIPGLAQGYAGPDNPFGGTDAMIKDGKFAVNPQFEWTGGGFASTSKDLARWAKSLYEGRAFDRRMLAEMLVGVPARLGPEAKYGLGVIIRPTPRGITYGHSGFFPGYMTEMTYFPDMKTAIAVQVNTSVPRNLGRPLGRFVLEFAEIIAQEQQK
jgi:D-alanyl-D-alanine carboxypeptidase